MYNRLLCRLVGLSGYCSFEPKVEIALPRPAPIPMTLQYGLHRMAWAYVLPRSVQASGSCQRLDAMMFLGALRCGTRTWRSSTTWQNEGLQSGRATTSHCLPSPLFADDKSKSPSSHWYDKLAFAMTSNYVVTWIQWSITCNACKLLECAALRAIVADLRLTSHIVQQRKMTLIEGQTDPFWSVINII